MTLARYLVGFSAICTLSGSATGQEGEPVPSPQAVRETVRGWVRAQKTLSEEAAGWEEAKRSMADLNSLRKKEIAQIDEIIAAAGARLEDAEERKSALEAERESLRKTRSEMEGRIGAIEDSIRKSAVFFPPPLREKMGEALERLENVGDDDDVPLQNRFRDAVVVLGAAGQFHHALTVASEVRDFGNERVEVDVLYLGFSGAWYVDRSGGRAGRGAPGDTGWIWEEDDGLAKRVREAISMYEKKVAPGFIGLPIEPAKPGMEK